MNTPDFNRLVDSIREDTADVDSIRLAGTRVRQRLEAEVGGEASSSVARLDSCADFRTLRNQPLSEARRMLLEDHLHSCVACRKFFAGTKSSVIPFTSRKPIVRQIMPWAIAAGLVLAAGLTLPPVLDRTLAPSGPRATVASVDGMLYRVSAQGSTALAAGATIGEKDEIRSGKDSHAVLRLRDGSMVELAERSDLTLSERWSGKTVRLERGSVMVEAAKQRRGRLEVSTPDCLVSVKGTIFEVSRGTKGSRVSVVEGEVKVDQDGATQLLHRGDQKATSSSMANTSVAEDVGWSHNSAKYLALLGELSAIQKRIEAIPGPGLRYQSKLAGLLPENTMVFASIPNLGPTLAEANNIFEERVTQSAVLREWWNEAESQKLRAIVNQVRTFSDYLGDEIVLAVPADSHSMQDPILLAEARRPELRTFLEQQFAMLRASGQGSAPQLITDPRSAVTGHGPLVMVHGNVVALGSQQATLARVAALADSGAAGGFLATPFWARISQSYQSGAGWLFAANMEQILAHHVPQGENVTNPTTVAGMDNVRYLVIERKGNLGRTENSAALSFAGDRKGLASWLASPGPMGTLDFVSPDASFSGSFVLKNPGTLLQELLALAGSQAGSAEYLAKFQQETGIDLINGVAGTLGGEMTVAVDGPLLPTPSWKVAVEVENPALLESSIEQAISTSQRDYPDAGVQLTKDQVNGLTYYTLTAAKLPTEIDYVFTDGYLLMGPSRALLTSAMQSRASGMTLPHSAAFRAQLPQDGHVNFSALLYYNLGSTIGPMVDQLKSSGLMSPEQQQSVAMLTANREPGLIYAFGEPDRVVVGSRSGFFGLGLDTLVGLNGKGAGLALPQLLGPLMSPMARKAGAEGARK